MANERRKTVVVAGASGFIGRALPQVLGARFDLVGLSRAPKRAAAQPGAGAFEWRKTDLYSRAQTVEALRGADLAVYLVHSLRPSAKLTQGEIGDLDVICADNFARAARHHGVEHIVYVSRTAPDDASGADYLASRREVASTLASHGTPVTTLRASLVVGPGGATNILAKLIERLPVMGLPRWTETRFCPIALGDLVELIDHVLERPEFAGEAYEVGGSADTSFREMLEMTADLTGRRRRFFSIPLTSPDLSTAWLSLWTGQPRRVVRPLVESLQHDLLPADRRLQRELGQEPTPVDEALERAIRGERSSYLATREAPEEETSALVARPEANEVRAIHRLALPRGRSAAWVADEYRRWLPRFFRPLIDVERDGADGLYFYLRPLPWPVLELEFDHSVSDEQRQLYWIRGGLLARRHERARLEFREVLDGRKVLAAIHEFRPSLPWLLYVYTQAKIHHFTMRSFDRHLRRKAEAIKKLRD